MKSWKGGGGGHGGVVSLFLFLALSSRFFRRRRFEGRSDGSSSGDHRRVGGRLPALPSRRRDGRGVAVAADGMIHERVVGQT